MWVTNDLGVVVWDPSAAPAAVSPGAQLLADVRQAQTENGIYHHYGAGGNDWDVLNGVLFIWPGRGGNPPSEILAAYPIASDQRTAEVMDPRGPGNGEGGSDIANILTGAAFVFGGALASGFSPFDMVSAAAPAADAGSVAIQEATLAPIASTEPAAEAFTLADPWGAGTPGLLDAPAPLEAATGNVIDAVAPEPSAFGASGAALPSSWQVALGVPGASPPVFTTLPSVPTPAPSSPAAPITKAAAASTPGLLERLTAGAAVPIASSVLGHALTQTPATGSTPAITAGAAPSSNPIGTLLLVALAGGAYLFTQ